MKLDKKDRRIMYELDLNSRSPVSEISNRLSINKNVVNYRINRLIESGFISGFYALIDTPRLGFEGFRIYMKFQHISPEREREIIDYLVSCPSTWWVGSLDGMWDLGVVVWARNVYDFKDFWNDFTGKYRNFLESYKTAIYTGLYNFTQAYISPDESPRIVSEFIGGRKTVEINRTEEKVLKLLSENARLSIVEIAKKLDTTAMVVKYKVNKLKKLGIIKSFRTIYNFNKLNLTHYKADFELSDISRYKDLVNFAESQKNIIYVDQTVGGSDFEIELLAESHADFKKIIDDIRERFSDVIRSYNYIVYSKIHKIRYF